VSSVTLSTRARSILVDSPNSFAARARARRWELVRESFPDFEGVRVLDLGGTVSAWEAAPMQPAHVTVLNLFEPGESASEHITALTGDACDAVAELERQAIPASFDIVFSNAVLEHVGGHANRQRFADSVSALAPRHWIQTPYRYFPVEPHWLFPGMQFLPVAVRARIARTWRLAHTPARTMAEARSSVLWTELIGITELREYFPDSAIVHERAAGLTKSIIAVRA
jgi:hypothetical protein